MGKSKSKTYTTPELARHFNISVASASRFIVKHRLKPVKTGQYNAKYYSDAVFQRMEECYQNEPKTQEKQTYPATKDTITEQLKTQAREQVVTIELLKQQLTVRDEQITAASKLANQVQQLNLTIHKQRKSLPQPSSNSNKTVKHSWFWRVTC